MKIKLMTRDYECHNMFRGHTYEAYDSDPLMFFVMSGTNSIAVRRTCAELVEPLIIPDSEKGVSYSPQRSVVIPHGVKQVILVFE